MKKPLCFKNQRFGYAKKARRDKVEYEIIYSEWHDGESTATPEGLRYHVRRFDTVAKDSINTINVRRFATIEKAKQFCQDMYEGIIDLDALKAEMLADAEDRERKKRDNDRAKVDTFKDLLNKKGVELSDFMELVSLWRNIGHDSYRLLNGEVEKP